MIRGFRALLICSLAWVLAIEVFLVPPQTPVSPTKLLVGQASPIEQPNESPAKISPQQVFAPHWSTKNGFNTKIYIRNVHINQTITAKLSLITAHRIVTLPDAHIEPLQTISVDVAQALTENGESTEQSGGARIDFQAESSGAVNAYAQVLNTSNSLGFYFPFMQNSAPTAGSLDAVAWYYSKNTDAFVALQNTTEKTVTVAPTISVAGRTMSLGKRRLKPYGAATIKIPSPEHYEDDNQRSVGLRIAYSGKPGAVIAQGWTADEKIGFSTSFAFHQPSKCDCAADTQHLYGTGLQIGASATMAGAIFTPYLAAKNRSEKPLTVTPIFQYAVGDGTDKVTLPSITLNPQESALVNLLKYREDGTIPSWVSIGSIDLQYTGEGGEVIAELASVDQSGSMINPVPLSCRGGRALHMSFWRTDGDWQSSILIQNIAPEENDVEVTISYPGGIYVIERMLAAGATTEISVNQLQQSQEPDKSGRRIPKEAASGGMNLWSRNINDGLVINSMLVNPVTKTCGSCNGAGYATGAYLIESDAPYTATGFREHFVGDRFSLRIEVRYSTGGSSQDSTNTSTTRSSNTAVARYDGAIVANGVGSATISADTLQRYFRDYACSQSYPLTARSTLTVNPAISSITPARGLIGNTIQITINGDGFGATPKVNVPANGGITVSNVSAANGGTQVKATFAIAVDATGGDKAISVTAGGKTSNSKNFFVQVPTSFKVLSASVFPGQTANGAPPSKPYGFALSIRYQVMDQATTPQPIMATMRLKENLLNAKVDGQSAGSDNLDTNVTTSGFTEGDGTFVDQPVGVTNLQPFGVAIYTQELLIELSSSNKPVLRTNDWNISGRAGCGRMTNNNDIDVRVTCP
ncbi:MAG: hypothetical protein MSG64_15970 [Pyrinomonadaceae bacterium MAG19_C2-C3]|nr:hypothetical protein [Pyrinomonadaceae bacterium MAG19_C2-C3]